MITELTQEQTDKFPEYVEKWKSIGLSTEAFDYEKAKTAISNYYVKLGLEAPKRFFKWISPYQAAHGIAIFNILEEEVEDPIAFIEGLDEETKAKVTDSQLLRDAFESMVYGSMDAHWVSFYSFFHNETEVEGLDIVEELEEICKHCGWWSPFKEAAVLQCKPSHIKFDDQERLHCEDGPAIAYDDGYGVYAWHGVRVPKEWIETPEVLTAEIALTWENVEERRCACEILGWINVLEALDYRTIDSNPNPQIGTLVEVDIPEIGDNEKYLMVKCGTGRDFALPVPPETGTALGAQAWLNFCSEDDILNLEVRT